MTNALTERQGRERESRRTGPSAVRLKAAAIVGVFWDDHVRREPRANAAAMMQLAQWYAQGKVKPAIDSRLPMSEIRAAYARMATRQVLGKVVPVNG